MDDFLKKLKKLVRIVLYGRAISQPDCKKASPYQLPLIINLHDPISFQLTLKIFVCVMRFVGVNTILFSHPIISWRVLKL